VEGDFHFQLFLFDPAVFLGIVLVDELDGKDGVIAVVGSGFLDAETRSIM
jgi:hypothetical protein